MANAKELYNQALKAFSAGDKNKGLSLLQESLEADSYNLDGWVKLAEVMPDDETKYEILEQILTLDPDNDFANSEWDRLNQLAESGKLGASDVVDEAPEQSNADFLDDIFGSDEGDSPKPKAAKDDDGKEKKGISMPQMPANMPKMPDVDLSAITSFNLDGETIPGVKNKEMVIVISGLLILTLFMCFLTFSVINSATARFEAENAAATALVVGRTQTLEANATNIAAGFATETQIAFDLTATVVALVSPTPSPVQGFLADITEVPPTATPTEAVITARVASAPPEGLPGTILAWGGTNFANANYLSLYSVNPSSMEVTTLNDEDVSSPTIDTVGNRLIYMRYNPNTRGTTMDLLSPDDPTAFSTIMDTRFPAVSELKKPSLSPTGNYLVFIARANSTGRNEVFLWDFITEELTQMTNDGANYLSAAVSPVGNQIIAVREQSGGTDLVRLDRDAAPEGQAAFTVLLTTDGGETLESDVSFSPDGTRILYRAERNGNGDIVMMDMATQVVTTVIESDADEMLPFYSPDSRFIVYSSNANGRYNLFIVDTISGQRYQITERMNEPVYAAGWYN